MSYKHILLFLAFLFCTVALSAQVKKAPAYPLVTCDPGFSIWAYDDSLPGAAVRQAGGEEQALLGLIRVDTQTYVFLGDVPGLKLPRAVQNGVVVGPTVTFYDMMCGSTSLELRFLSPLLPTELTALGRTISYVEIQLNGTNRTSQKVDVYLGVAADLITSGDTSGHIFTESLKSAGALHILRAGVEEGSALKKTSDLRLSPRPLYLAGPKLTTLNVATLETVLRDFPVNGAVQGEEFMSGKKLWLGAVMHFKETLPKPPRMTFMLAREDVGRAPQVLGQNLEPWSKTQGDEGMTAQLQKGLIEYTRLRQDCEDFDFQLISDAAKAGGNDYSRLCALAFRQAMSTNRLMRGKNKEALWLNNFSNSTGYAGDVDQAFATSPLWLAYNPELVKAALDGLFAYDEEGKWSKSFAPHDLGVYPRANGQASPEDSPVEASADAILLTAAYVKKSAAKAYAQAHWKSLSRWASYLERQGLDPARQPTGDAPVESVASDANLAAKAIIALGAYAWLADQLGETETATKFQSSAKAGVANWLKLAVAGDHYAQVFGKKKTWSQKYNLVWDKLLGLNLFPPDVAKKEIAFYLKNQNRYGLPLEGKQSLSRLDRIASTAALAERPEDFQELIAPLSLYVKETPDRGPLSNWYDTSSGRVQVQRADAALGGIFMPLLLWKWAQQ